MKINFLNFCIILVSIYISLLVININAPYIIFCEGAEAISLNNNYWKIEEYKSDIWHVLFKNVGVKYEISRCHSFNDVHTSRFDFKEINSNVIFSRQHNNIIDATMEHFNDIQRGNYHADLENKINPNSHGKNKMERDIRSPLDQFLIKDLLIIIMPFIANLYISYTNMALYLTIATLVITTIYLLITNLKKIETNYWYIAIESLYSTIYSIVVNQINSIKGQNFFPFIYCLFIFILVNNLIGMVPYSFAPTSHFILTFFISFTVVIGSTILGFILHNLKFFSLLVPNGCPLALLPLLVLIETVSYLARNVSLGLRLAANILSGHMLLNILSEFTYKIMDTSILYFFIGIIPLMFIGAFSALELGIAFIQSQVFVVLSSSYIKDSLELH